MGKINSRAGRFSSAAIMLAMTLGFSAACYKGQRKYPPADHSVYDIPYAKGIPGEEFLTLDAHWPAGARGLPVVMYIHGGGWTTGDKDQMDVWSKRIANRGYVVVNVNYRLAPKYPFPAAVNDCLGALAWVKENAREYGGDPDRIGVTGGSAGGHLTAMVATAARSPWLRPTGREDYHGSLSVKAQAPFFGVFDFNQPGFFALTNIRQQFLGGGPGQVPEIYRQASPINYVRPDVPPTLIVVGKLDPIYDQSRLYCRALKAAGANVELQTYAGKGHAFESYMWTKDSEDSFERMIKFFDKRL